MDWYKLSEQELSNFLDLNYRDPTLYPSLIQKITVAQLIFDQIAKNGGQLTVPVRDLYIASLHKNSPIRYISSQIQSLAGINRVRMAEALYLDINESNLNDHILKILRLANLIKNDKSPTLNNVPSDIIKLIGEQLKFSHLINYCRATNSIYRTCEDEIYWANLLDRDFNFSATNSRRAYQQLVTLQNKFPDIFEMVMDIGLDKALMAAVYSSIAVKILIDLGATKLNDALIESFKMIDEYPMDDIEMTIIALVDAGATNINDALTLATDAIGDNYDTTDSIRRLVAAGATNLNEALLSAVQVDDTDDIMELLIDAGANNFDEVATVIVARGTENQLEVILKKTTIPLNGALEEAIGLENTVMAKMIIDATLPSNLPSTIIL